MISHSDWINAIRPLPAGTVVCAIGDVHGRADLLEEVHTAINECLAIITPRETHCIHLGDLIDRGPNSLASLNLARHGIPGAHNHTLIGNHEHRLLKMLDDPSDSAVMTRWLKHGGTEFFSELGIERRFGWHNHVIRKLGLETLNWLKSLPLMVRLGDLLFVHAGIDPNMAIASQGAETLAWIREPWLTSAGPYEDGLAVVHGHTPVDQVDFENRDRLNLDTGASETGILSALIIAGTEMKVLQTLP